MEKDSDLMEIGIKVVEFKECECLVDKGFILEIIEWNFLYFIILVFF